MTEKRKESGGAMPNEGEGSRTGARQYDKAAERFAKSGKVEEKAREAREAIEGKEGKELAEAEAAGKRHIAEEDPEIKKR
ncbi:MAG TPA: hypothetical protein VFA50_06465 [Stellaceae bacterium]|nr:hypothetical protein [Stellaceae bacterium]